ncbi:MAG: hypothetical protein JWP27_2319 [Flaviaesturariibacter sp.]|nr:hypothetical protein [Flaviaesturariibacter sp.]
MSEQDQHLDALQDIRRMMNNSSRFISLSGWSGVAAGTCALLSAIYTANKIECWKRADCRFEQIILDGGDRLQATLVQIAAVTFAAALVLAFLFTWLRSRKTGVPIWGYSARKLMVQVAVPMVAGGLVIWRMMDFGLYGLVAPACLIFYGLALVNASKYTLPEIRFLGYFQLALGIVNLWMIGYGLYFWAAGFGVLHIVYGIIMWNKYERGTNS